jgi:Flp pilus assembly pilin Flp
MLFTEGNAMRPLEGCKMKRFKVGPFLDEKGQNLIEYALVASIVAAVVFAMSTYVFRNVQATQQLIEKESRRE